MATGMAGPGLASTPGVTGGAESWNGTKTLATGDLIISTGNLSVSSGTVRTVNFSNSVANTFGFGFSQGGTDSGTWFGIRVTATSAISNAAARFLEVVNNAVTKFGVNAAGKIIYPVGAADSVAGRTALSSGTVTVSTTSVTASSIILLTRVVAGGTVGELQVGTVTASTSFVINSVQPGTASTIQSADTCTVAWLVIN